MLCAPLVPHHLSSRLDDSTDLTEAIAAGVEAFFDRLGDWRDPLPEDDETPFTVFRRLYPHWIGDEAAIRLAFDRLHLDRNARLREEFFDGLDRWLRSKTWLDGFICSPLKWILERRWEKYPQPSGKPALISDRQRDYLARQPRTSRANPRPPEPEPEPSIFNGRLEEMYLANLRGKIHSSNSTPTVAEVKQGRAEAIRQIKAAPDNALAVIEQVTNATALHSDEAP